MPAQAFFTIVLFVSAVAFFAPNLLESGKSEYWAVAFLLVFVVAYAIARASRSSLLRGLIRVGIPIAALLVFAGSRSGGDPALFWPLVGQILAIAIVFFGIFRMVYGALPKKTKRERERDG